MHLAYAIAALAALQPVLSTSVNEARLRELPLVYRPASKQGRDFFRGIRHEVAQTGVDDSKLGRSQRQLINNKVAGAIKGWDEKREQPILDDLSVTWFRHLVETHDPDSESQIEDHYETSQAFKILSGRTNPAMRRAYLDLMDDEEVSDERGPIKLNTRRKSDGAGAKEHDGHQGQERPAEPNTFHVPPVTVRGQALRYRGRSSSKNTF